MEGKALLFKEFGGVDAVPICLDCTDVDEIVETVARLAPGVRRHQPRGHLGARAASRSSAGCRTRLDIPVFHDDQHGTAIVTLAALRNAAAADRPRAGRPAGRRVGGRRRRCRDHQDPAVGRRRRRRGRRLARASSTAAGPTSARSSVTWPPPPTRRGRTGTHHRRAARRRRASSASPAGTIPEAAVAAMARDSIVFAMANPDPEVHPDRGGAPRPGRRHRAQRLPQPDQQRAGLPRRLPGRPGGAAPPASPRA